MARTTWPNCTRRRPARKDKRVTDDDGQAARMAEFVALRQEIQDRSANQYQMFSLQITTAGTIFGFVLSRPDITTLLAIVPFSSYLLCARVVSQHDGINRLGRYIREELSPHVTGGLGWEDWSQRHQRRHRFLGLTLPHVMTFPGPSLVALIWTAPSVFAHISSEPGLRVAQLAAWIAGLCFTVISLTLLAHMHRLPRPAVQHGPRSTSE
jgi:hypothetical protein